VTPRSRLLSFGTAAVLVIVGIALAAVSSISLWQIVGAVLSGLGLILAVSLAFLEVGLSEDHARERDERGRSDPHRPAARTASRPASRRLKPRRMDRARGHRRRLR
jgi:cell division protein FtsW (lipid II flippase)